jgi:hypothetical protein
MLPVAGCHHLALSKADYSEDGRRAQGDSLCWLESGKQAGAVVQH